MATYTFSALQNNQIIAFNPLTDVLVFDTYLSGGNPVSIRPAELLINGTASGVQFVIGGKSIVLSGIGLDALGTSTATGTANVQFIAPGQLLVGETTTGGGDELPNSILGGTGDDALLGLGGADILNGGVGADLMVGGLGDDTYKVDNAGDVVTEENTSIPGSGIDIVEARVSYTLTNYVENLLLTGSAAIDGSGNGLNNTLTGNSAANVLDGKLGADRMVGGDGNDTYVVDNSLDIVVEKNSDKTQIDTVNSSITYALGANVENLVLTGFNSSSGIGNQRNNQITGNSVANTLNGSGGADTMTGGDGNDTYIVDNVLDAVIETNALATQIDMVATAFSYVLGGNLENLRLLGSANIDGTGNALNNVLYANAGNNILDGLGGSDTASYADVSLLTIGLNPLDFIPVITSGATAGVVVDLNIAGSQDTKGSGFDTLLHIENVTGSSFADELTGNSSNNILDGGLGADLLAGGNGNDTFIVDGADVVVEANGNAGGFDTVFSSVSYRLAANVEYLELTGSNSTHGIGNDLANQLTGNAGANFLDGRAGADKMSGRGGNDTYVVDNLGDEVDEVTLGSGIDLVQAYINYVLASSIENLRLMGQNALDGTGNILSNVFWVNAGDNTVDGADGIDTLSYQFGANSGVTVDLSLSGAQATGGSGTDTVTGFENLTGSDYADWLSGTDSVNVLDGAGGNDTVSYAGASAGVTVNLAEHKAILTGALTGFDTVWNFENIFGSGFADILIGNLGDNIINGGGGVDTVSYQNVKLDEGGVTVNLGKTAAQDTLGSGFDTLLGIENLIGSQNDDILIGNAQRNELSGSNGNDVLQGRGGADRLSGGIGDDRFSFTTTSDSADTARDIISDFLAGSDKMDIAGIDAKTSTAADNAFAYIGIAAAFTAAGQIRLEQSGADTIVYFNTNANQASEMTIVLQNVNSADLGANDFVL